MLAWALLYAAQQGLVLDVLQTEQLNLASSCQAIFVALGACLAFGAAVALPSSLHYHYQSAAGLAAPEARGLCQTGKRRMTAHSTYIVRRCAGWSPRVQCWMDICVASAGGFAARHRFATQH